MNNFERVDFTPQPDDHEPTSDEIQAVIDMIDLLIAAEDTPPYDVATLPRTTEEMMEYMQRNGKKIAGLYPIDVPAINLLPVENLLEFKIKRFPRESAMHHPGIALIKRVYPIPEMGADATRIETIFIDESSEGLKVHREFSEKYNDGRKNTWRNFFSDQEMHEQMGLNKVSSKKLAIVKRQLSTTRIII